MILIIKKSQSKLFFIFIHNMNHVRHTINSKQILTLPNQKLLKPIILIYLTSPKFSNLVSYNEE